MALTDRSAWQPSQGTKEPLEKPEPGTGLTLQQTRAEGARHPAGQGLQNNVIPKEEPKDTVSVGEQAKETQRQVERGAQPRPMTPQDQAMQSTVAQLSARMGNLGYTLQAYVNEFLTSAAQNVGQNTEEVVQYNPDGTLKISQTNTADIEPVVQEKIGQQQLIRSAVNPFTKEVAGKLTAKSFSDVLRDQLDDDPQAAELLQLFQQLDQLDQNGAGDSAEARASRERLKELDRSGLISGLRRARDEYQRLMGGPGRTGATWYGDQGDEGFTVLDMANASTDFITQEVEKSLLTASGLFGGDFEANLKRSFDTESAASQQSARRREQLHNELYNAVSAWANDASTDLGAAMESYQAAFQQIGEKVRDALIASGDTDAARLWLEGMQGGNIEDLIFNAISDEENGLSTEQRAELAGLIEQLSPTAETGWLMTMARTGKMWVKNSDGTSTEVAPTQDQVMKIIEIAQSDMSEEAKNSQLRKIVENIRAGDQSLRSMVEDALVKNSKTGLTDTALQNLQTSIVNSLQTFAKSYTEDLARQAIGLSEDQWRSLSPEKRTELLRQTLLNNPDALEDARGAISARKVADAQELAQLKATWDKTYQNNLAALNLNTNELLNQYEKIDAAEKSAPQIILSQTLSWLSNTDNFATMYEKVKQNPWIRQQLQKEILTTDDLTTYAKFLMYQNDYKYARGQIPLLAQSLIASGGDANFIESDSLTMMQNPTQLRKVVAAYEAQLAKIQQSNDPALQAAALQWLQAQQANPAKANAFGSTMLTWMDKLKAAKTKIQESGTKLQSYKTEFEGAKAFLDAVGSQGFYSIDPDQILKTAIGAAKGTEQQQLPAEIMAGIEQLGIPSSAVKLENGVPYVNMGGSTYVPLTDDLYAAILAATQFQKQPMLPDLESQIARPDLVATPEGNTSPLAYLQVNRPGIKMPVVIGNQVRGEFNPKILQATPGGVPAYAGEIQGNPIVIQGEGKSLFGKYIPHQEEISVKVYDVNGKRVADQWVPTRINPQTGVREYALPPIKGISGEPRWTPDGQLAADYAATIEAGGIHPINYRALFDTLEMMDSEGVQVPSVLTNTLNTFWTSVTPVGDQSIYDVVPPNAVPYVHGKVAEKAAERDPLGVRRSPSGSFEGAIGEAQKPRGTQKDTSGYA